MPELLELRLRDWLDKHPKSNPGGYLFVNSKGKPFLSDNVVKYGVHRAMKKLGLALPGGGTHVGIHCFRHGITSELLEAGTPIHIVSRLMRHGDSKVTSDHYAHVIGDVRASLPRDSPGRSGPTWLNWSQSLNWSQLRLNLLGNEEMAEACESRTHHSAR